MVIAYLKITDGRQHLELQRNEIEGFALAKGFEVNKWVMEVVDDKRKEKESTLYQVIDRMSPGDKVIITDIVRFGRTLSEVLGLLGRCMANGVHLYSIDDRYMLDDSFDMAVVADACQIITKIEHNLMSTRTREALGNQRTRGLKLGRPSGTNAKQTLLDDRKEEVMKMIERGESVATICKYFNVSRNTYYRFKNNYGL